MSIDEGFGQYKNIPASLRVLVPVYPAVAKARPTVVEQCCVTQSK